MGLFSGLSRRRSGYNVWKLVNRRIFASEQTMGQEFQIISDIDKTYLDTAFETIGGLAKIAIETADEKKSIDGARYFLRHLKWDAKTNAPAEKLEVPLHFVSSSPPQLRSVLEEKISMDGLTWSSDSFKDQIYNLKRGKLSLLKHQVSYKMASILSLCNKFTDPQKILLIGDNAETDPYIYMLIKGLLTDSLSSDECVGILSKLGVSARIGNQIFKKVTELPNVTNVPILIRKIPGKSYTVPKEFLGKIYYFDDYFQASIICHSLEILTLNSVCDVLVGMHNFHGYSVERGFNLFKYYLEENGLNKELEETLQHDRRLKKIFDGLMSRPIESRLDQSDIELVKQLANSKDQRDQETNYVAGFSSWL